MAATLEALLRLQDIELQIVDIRRQIAAKERLVKRQATRLNAVEERLGAEREALHRAQMEVDEIDVDLKGRTAQVNRLREHLNTVRTNREYAAILAKLNNEKADASRLEARALQVMEATEARRKTLAQCEEEERAEAAKFEDFKAQSEHARRTFARKLAELQQGRAEAEGQLDGKTVTLFNRLSERYEGEVLARINRTHPRRDEFTCDGCHMTLSAECYNALLVRDEVQTCGNCGRILYTDRNG